LNDCRRRKTAVGGRELQYRFVSETRPVRPNSDVWHHAADAFYGNNAGSYSGDLEVGQSNPIVLSITNPVAGLLTISWTTVSGQKYQLLYSTNVGTADWSAWGPVLTATNDTLFVQDSIAADTQRLYRVEWVP
jgi:hypothetical protein